MAKTMKKTVKKSSAKSTKTKATKTAAKTKKSASSRKKPTITQQELISLIEKRAYEIYLERGGAHGDDQADWYKAEQELRKKYNISN